MRSVVVNNEEVLYLDLRDSADSKRWEAILKATEIQTSAGETGIFSVECGDMIVIELKGLGKAVRSTKGSSVIMTPSVKEIELLMITGDIKLVCPVCRSEDVRVGHLKSVSVLLNEPCAVGGRTDNLRHCVCNAAACGMGFWL